MRSCGEDLGQRKINSVDNDHRSRWSAFPRALGLSITWSNNDADVSEKTENLGSTENGRVMWRHDGYSQIQARANLASPWSCVFGKGQRNDRWYAVSAIM
jgi:hypothetical protein